MAIGPGQPGFPFTEASIRANAPNTSGTYAIYRTEAWIYFGESNDLQRRLLEHLREAGTCIHRQAPTGFQVEVAAAQQRVVRQNQLIAQFRPACNQMLG